MRKTSAIVSLPTRRQKKTAADIRLRLTMRFPKGPLKVPNTEVLAAARR